MKTQRPSPAIPQAQTTCVDISSPRGIQRQSQQTECPVDSAAGLPQPRKLIRQGPCARGAQVMSRAVKHGSRKAIPSGVSSNPPFALALCRGLSQGRLPLPDPLLASSGSSAGRRPRVKARMSRFNPVARISQSQTRARSSGLSPEQMGCKGQGSWPWSQTWVGSTISRLLWASFFLTRASFCVSLVRFAYSPEFIKHFTCVVARAAVLEGMWRKACLCPRGIVDVLVERRVQIKQPVSKPGLQQRGAESGCQQRQRRARN